MLNFALTLYNLETDLTRAMRKEEMTDTYTEKLGSCGPCLMEMH